MKGKVGGWWNKIFMEIFWSNCYMGFLPLSPESFDRWINLLLKITTSSH